MKLNFLVCLLLLPFVTAAQQTDRVLEEKIARLVKGFKGDVGVYVYHLKQKKEATYNADTIFPTASVVKVPIMIAVFQKVKEGAFSLNDKLVYNSNRVYGGSGLMQYYKDSTVTDIRTLTSLMITVSDNVTSLWCQELVGGGAYINQLMADLGLEHTRVNSRTEGREEIWKKYGWGQTTPREMASLLIKLRERKLVDEASSDEMYRLMCHTFYTDYSLSQIPPYVQTAAKQGMVNRSRSELVMVNAPHGDYVFYIATKNNKDESWKHDNEAWQLQRALSSLLWNYFEPKSGWKPAAGHKQLVKDTNY
ncbi:MAG: serine hydrolase [Cyclobacteriaceae bacterium]|nr:serine hydrolase [Cyclobacteriaceae bacterium]